MKTVLFFSFILLSLGMPQITAEGQTREGRTTATQPSSPAFEGKSEGQSANHTSAPDTKVAASGADATARISTTPLTSDTALPIDPPVNNSLATPAPATSVYRVGVGDVLDIQLLNSTRRESTLYSVLAGGSLEYPLAGEAVRILGLTTDEIARILTARVKIYEKPQITVSVREYASHNVIVTGLARDPGTKALRREAVPLFVLLAEAQPRPEAARAIIMRPDGPTQTVDISDTSATSVLIYPNDVIRLVGPLPANPLYFYIVGQVATPGQRDFHSGMTLTQAIFAAGGTTKSAVSKAKVMRQAADGRLITTEYDMKRISQGRDPDPPIEAGDRIEIGRSNW